MPMPDTVSGKPKQNGLTIAIKQTMGFWEGYLQISNQAKGHCVLYDVHYLEHRPTVSVKQKLRSLGGIPPEKFQIK